MSLSLKVLLTLSPLDNCFSPTPCVQFIHKDDDDFSSPFPMANTCINSIKLPLHTSYQVFKEKFDFALGNTYDKTLKFVFYM
uniref:HECT domain-containing protein n=1 Tax=Fundulus heteroclitus TaxID=8078 RepID=A0A3Q2QF75_FUNHE